VADPAQVDDNPLQEGFIPGSSASLQEVVDSGLRKVTEELQWETASEDPVSSNQREGAAATLSPREGVIPPSLMFLQENRYLVYKISDGELSVGVS